MSGLLFALLLAASGPSAAAEGSGLMVVPESAGTPEAAAPQAEAGPEAEADAELLKQSIDVRKAYRLYKRALEQDKLPATLPPQAQAFAKKRRAVLLVKLGMAQLMGGAYPARLKPSDARKYFAEAEMLDSKQAFAKWGLAETTDCAPEFGPWDEKKKAVTWVKWGSDAGCERSLSLLSAAIQEEPRCGYFYYERSYFTATKLYNRLRTYRNGRANVESMTSADCKKAGESWLDPDEWHIPKLPSPGWCDKDFGAAVAFKFLMASLGRRPLRQEDVEDPSIPIAKPRLPR